MLVCPWKQLTAVNNVKICLRSNIQTNAKMRSDGTRFEVPVYWPPIKYHYGISAKGLL